MDMNTNDCNDEELHVDASRLHSRIQNLLAELQPGNALIIVMKAEEMLSAEPLWQVIALEDIKRVLVDNQGFYRTVDAPDILCALGHLTERIDSAYKDKVKASRLSLLKCRRAVDQDLEADYDPGLRSHLNQLGADFHERFRLHGDLDDLDDAVEAYRLVIHLTPDGDPGKPSSFISLATGLNDMFEKSNNIADLDASINAYRLAVQQTPEGHPDKPSRMHDLAVSLDDRFERLGEVEDLETAVSMYRHAVRLTPQGDPNHPWRLNNFASSLRNRFRRMGQIKDLEESIHLSCTAIELTPDGNSDKPSLLNNLAASLNSRYQRLGDASDLEQAIEKHRRAVGLTPDSDSNKPARLNNFAVALDDRFERFGDVEDLGEAIKAYRDAIRLTPKNHSDLPSRLNNLAVSLGNRFELLGDDKDLEDTVITYREAVRLTPDDHPHKAACLNNLAASLDDYFERYGEMKDLEEAIDTYRRADLLTPDDHPDKPYRLNNLAISFRNCFERSGDMKDLEGAIGLYRRAIKLVSEDHPYMLYLLNNLVASLRKRFERFDEVQDLEEMINVSRRAARLTPEGHIDKPARLKNLAASLRDYSRYYGDSESEALNEAISKSRLAVELTPDDHLNKSSCLDLLACCLEDRYERLGDVKDIEEATNMYRLAIKLLSDNHPEKCISFNNLAAILRTLFERSKNMKHLDEAMSAHRHALELASHKHPQVAVFLKNFATSLESRFHNSHDAKDIGDALKAFMQAAEHTSGRLVVRLQAALRAIHLVETNSACMHDMQNMNMRAYKCIMDLLPQVAWLGRSVQRRWEELSQIGDLVNSAAGVAVTAGDLTQAVEWLEEGRSIIWGQFLRLRSPLDELRKQHPRLARALEDVSHQLNGGSTLVSVLSKSQENSADESRKTRRLTHDRAFSLAAEYHSLLNRIRSLDGFQHFLQPKRLDDLRVAASEGPILFVNVHQKSSDALVLFADGPVQHVPLPLLSLARVNKLREDFLTCLNGRGIRVRALKQVPGFAVGSMEDILSKLWNNLAKPIVSALERCDVGNDVFAGCDLPHVTWCLTGPLAFLPIHAAGMYNASNNDQVALMDRVVSSYAPSIEILLQSRARVTSINPKGSGVEVLAVVQPHAPGHTSIPKTLEEAKLVRKHFPRGVTLKDDRGSISAVLEEMAKHDWVHFACHGVQNPLDPAKSAFALNDGMLELSQLMPISFKHAELAFLSACQTATGDSSLPEEAVHLAAGMLVAGFKSVVATMWSINDADAPIVADSFYEALRDDVDAGRRVRPAYALHRALQRLRKNIGVDGFVRWVPFVHFGQDLHLLPPRAACASLHADSWSPSGVVTID
ncbi:hypothetical protein GYMLUDRAFT_98321 [Collybiopsis luxurians FD-317 M1]|uniref:CHAT domain-containing protein n=1 Tax=Collybiopsis luxurians FD-317 M1 TaxID=944289 RepID=A0A0D0C6I8_9AGAR|nr:hypothetical protein GYMLUDRAFT_98321 [Collybiopsis luxurians FD-317 M1]